MGFVSQKGVTLRLHDVRHDEWGLLARKVLHFGYMM